MMRVREPGMCDAHGRRWRLYPHAIRAANAYYSPAKICDPLRYFPDPFAKVFACVCTISKQPFNGAKSWTSGALPDNGTRLPVRLPTHHIRVGLVSAAIQQKIFCAPGLRSRKPGSYI